MEVNERKFNKNQISNKETLKIIEERAQQLKGSSYPPTLKSMCLKSIKAYFEIYQKAEENTGINPLTRLPNSLKTELLCDQTQFNWDHWEELLMNKSVNKIRIFFDPLWNGYFSKFLSSLAKIQPQLKKFTWCCNLAYAKKNAFGPQLTLMMSSCPSFANLQILDIKVFHCNDECLMLISTHLKKLRSLSILLSSVTEKGFSTLGALDELQYFDYMTFSNYETGHVFNMCLKYQPKIHQIGVSKRKMHYHIDFPNLPAPVNLGLRELALFAEDDIPEGITFSNVSSLWLEGSPGNYFKYNFAGCSKLTEIKFAKLDMDQCLRILGNVGHQIRKLSIGTGNEDLQLDLILRLCPNLRIFQISVSSEQTMTFNFPLNPNKHLQYLEVLEIFCCSERNRVILSPGILVQLLSAPNLHYLDLCNVDLAISDTEDIVDLLQKGKILQKLKSFSWGHSHIEDLCYIVGILFDQKLRDRIELGAG